MKKCKVLRDYHNDRGVKRKAGTTIKLPDTSAKMREHGGFVEILNPDKKPAPLVTQTGSAILHRGEAVVPVAKAVKKPEIKMQKCKILITFFDGKKRTAGERVMLTDAEANRHALAGRVKIIKPKKKPAKKKTAPKNKPAISSNKKSAGALAKPKKKAAKKRGKKNA